MTMNFPISEFDMQPFMRLNERDTVKISLDLVTHGNFALKTEMGYMTLERSHFREILVAFNGATKPSRRHPFWTGVVPARGMAIEHLVEVYACDDNHIKLISSTCGGSFDPDPGVPHYHTQMLVDVRTFTEISNTVDYYVLGNNTSHTLGSLE